MVVERKFTFDDFVFDVKSNSKQALLLRGCTLKNEKKIYFYISDSEKIEALSYEESDKQYILKITVGLLKECYKYIDENVRSYYEIASETNNLTEEAFIRLVSGTVSEMIFWHEFSHIARGHLAYLKKVDLDQGNYKENRRFVELDADIYSASIIFFKLYGIYVSKKNDYSLDSLMQAYSIGIRALFEVLYKVVQFENENHKESNHPHSLIRAYTAIIHGLSSPMASKLPEDTHNKCMEIVTVELLAFEFSKKCTIIDPNMLDEYSKLEWLYWYENKSKLDEYLMLERKRVTWGEKINVFFRRFFL